jgi:hypothetical protein
MKVSRLYEGDDGQSHWDEIEVSMGPQDGGNPNRSISTSHATFSELIGAKAIQFITVPADSVSDWHNTPRRQFVVLLEGWVDLETGDGKKRHFDPGEVFVAEDLTGQGHRSDTGPEGRTFMVVPIDDGSITT